MPSKAQHERRYAALPPFLKSMREKAGLSQRALGERLGKPQSWVYNCETGNRRVDITEFIDWAETCGASPEAAFRSFLQHHR